MTSAGAQTGERRPTQRRGDDENSQTQHRFSERTGATSPVDLSSLDIRERDSLQQAEFQHRFDLISLELKRFDARMKSTVRGEENMSRLEQCRKEHVKAMRLHLTFTDEDGKIDSRSVSVGALINQKLAHADYEALAFAFRSGTIELIWKNVPLAAITRDLGISDKHLVKVSNDRGSTLLKPKSGKGPGEMLADLIHRFAKAENPVNVKIAPENARYYPDLSAIRNKQRLESRKQSFALMTEYRRKYHLNQLRHEHNSGTTPSSLARMAQAIWSGLKSAVNWIKRSSQPAVQANTNTTTKSADALTKEIVRFQAFRTGVRLIHQLYNPLTVLSSQETEYGQQSQRIRNPIRGRVQSLSYCELKLKERGQDVTTIAMKIEATYCRNNSQRTLYLIPKSAEGSNGVLKCDLVELVGGKLVPLVFSQRPRTLQDAFKQAILTQRTRGNSPTGSQTVALRSAERETTTMQAI